MIFSRDHVRKGDREYQKGNLKRAAELYLKAKRFRQAAGVYAELGEVDKAVAVFVDSGHPRLAAELLEAEGRHKEAVAKYEEAGDHALAATACLKLKQYARAGRLFELAQKYRQAAAAFAEGGDVEQALRAWEAESEKLRRRRSESRDHALEKRIREADARRAEALASVGRHLEAARLWMEQSRPRLAARLFERAGSFGDAAGAHLAAGQADEALVAVERAPDADDELRAEIYLNCARHREAGEIFERMGRFDAAASAYEGAEAFAQAAVLWEKAESYGRAADFFLRVGRHQDAGRCFAKADRHDRAAEAFAQAGNDQSAADAYMAVGDLEKAGEHYLEAGFTAAAKEAFQAVSRNSPDYAGASLRLIPLLAEEGLVDAAEQRLAILRDEVEGVDAWALRYCEGRVEEARGRYPAAESCYQRVLAERHDYLDVAERLRDVRGKVGAGSGGFLRPETPPPSMPPGDPLRDTAPIAVAEFADAGTVPAAEAAPAPEERPQSSSGALSALADASALPFDLAGRIDAWWTGAEFFRAKDRRSKEPILLVSFPLAEVGDRVEGFRGVMRQVTALHHPAILKLHETLLASDKVLLLYEPFAGRTLGNLLAEERLPPLTSVHVIVQLATALTTAHKLGVTHQWVSPRTLLIDDSGRVKLVGIGLRDVLAEHDATSRAYLSPEVRADGVVGPASDVYSLGLLAMELLQAQMPAGWAEQPEVDPETIEWPEAVEQAVPTSARAVLGRALSRDPLARPSTAELTASLAAIGLVPGQVLNDRYEILDELGRGGMSRVYRARDRELDDEVAIKTVLTPTLGRSENEERLLREVQICRRISHPNVVRVHDFGRFPGGIFVIMELLDGPGLDVVVRDETPLPTARVRDFLEGIAGALGEAHRLKIIHRDLKPSNVIVVGDRVKVLDFGIARMDESGGAQLTRTGEVVGSPMFMAPEQIQGQPLAGTCDLYALGVIAYTLLSGREPFLADTTTAVVLKHLHEEPPDILELRPELEQPWIDLLGKLLAKKPGDRYQSAEELLAVLRELPV